MANFRRAVLIRVLALGVVTAGAIPSAALATTLAEIPYHLAMEYGGVTAGITQIRPQFAADAGTNFSTFSAEWIFGGGPFDLSAPDTILVSEGDVGAMYVANPAEPGYAGLVGLLTNGSADSLAFFVGVPQFVGGVFTPGTELALLSGQPGFTGVDLAGQSIGGIGMVIDALTINPGPGPLNGGMAFDLNARIIISDSPIPEPATLALLGVGLAGLGCSRRMRAH